METSRRSFLKGAVGTAAVAAAATLSIPTEAAKAPKKWDVTTDVVVIGFGGAGATTAISAAQNGANVVVLEKNPENHQDRKSTRLNSSHNVASRMPSSA